MSIDEIVCRAGVDPNTRYRHFSDKNDLVQAVLDGLVAGVATSHHQDRRAVTTRLREFGG